jgi:hypothetical protein
VARPAVAVITALAACGFEPGGTASTAGDASAGTDADTSLADASPDGSPDAPLVTCPPAYTLQLDNSTSRYRVIATAAVFATQHADCNNDQTDRTHLASPETAAEIADLRTALFALAAGQYYVGAVQQPNQATPTDGWFVFTGGGLPPGMFGNSNDDQPGENNEENLAALNTTDLFHDATGDVAYAAVCECDGLPIDPTVAGFIP